MNLGIPEDLDGLDTDRLFDMYYQNRSKRVRDDVFAVILGRHAELINGVVVNCAGWPCSKEFIEDTTQIIAEKLVKSLHTHKKGQSLKAFIATIARRACIDELRKYNRRTPEIPLAAYEDEGPNGPYRWHGVDNLEQPGEDLRLDIDRILTLYAMESQDHTDCVHVIKQRYFHDMTNAAIAAQRRCSEPTVHRLIARDFRDIRTLCQERDVDFSDFIGT